ncbi:MAG: hypothetical protein JXR37_33695 [Kiritimatiellae bacterium]|nr:hypothetical protein [Kiritimatiellia bacterium]
MKTISRCSFPLNRADRGSPPGPAAVRAWAVALCAAALLPLYAAESDPAASAEPAAAPTAETVVSDEAPASDETAAPAEAAAPDEAPASDEESADAPGPDEALADAPGPDEAPPPDDAPPPDETLGPDEAPPPDETPARAERFAPAEPRVQTEPRVQAERPGPSAPPMPAVEQPAAGGDGLRMNFQGASLSDVLNYLSQAAGFVVIQEVPVRGTVNIVSHQPLNNDEAVDLLNTVLADKGYVALRNGRILKIVDRKTAHTRSLPVRVARDPERIPNTDDMVTQIIPVRFADATRLIENLKPLMAETAKMTANESSNAIVLTDIQSNVRRMAEIIQALDTSISGIATIRVFPLEYADAKELADVIGKLFAADPATAQANAARDRRRFWMMRRGGPGGGDANAAAGPSEARQAATRVVAAADERSNSLIVCAPDDLMGTIEQLVADVDTNIAELTEVRVFHLENADATELAETIATLYADESTAQQANPRSGRRGGRGQTQATAQQSKRTLLQARVVAVGDPRTNTLMISAARETMMQIAELIGRLDAAGGRKQQVYVYPLKNGDTDAVADVLRGMFEGQATGGRRSTSRTGEQPSRLTERSSSGASSGVETSQGGRSAR